MYGEADEDTFLRRTRNAFTEAEKLMREENPSILNSADGAWDNESLRADRKLEESSAEPTDS
jgi:hypothetical protein